MNKLKHPMYIMYHASTQAFSNREHVPRISKKAAVFGSGAAVKGMYVQGGQTVA